MKGKGELQIGFWAILALAVLFFGVNYLKGINTMNQGSFYYLKCKQVNGLAASGHVTLHGMKVGTIREMEYDQKSNSVIVLFNIYDTDINIPVDSHVSTETDLLGTGSIVLQMGSSTTYYNTWDTITASDSEPGILQKADPVIESVTQLMPKIDTLVTGINVLVNQSKLQESLLNINMLTQKLNVTVTELNRLLKQDVPAIMGNVNDITANLDTVSLQLREANLRQVIAHADQTITQATSLLQNMQNDSTTVGKLMTTSELHDQLTNTIADVDSLINDIKAHPKRYIHIRVF